MTRAADDSSYCAALARAHDKDRFIASLYAPPGRRGALHALAAFAVEIGRARALAREALPGEVRLQWWRDTLSGHDHGGASGNPVAAALLCAIVTHDLPRERFEAFIEAHRAALYDEPLAAADDLDAHFDATSGALIGLAREILGGETPFDALTRAAGRAEGLTAMLTRQSPGGAPLTLIPRDWLDRFGIAGNDPMARREQPRFRELIEVLTARAEDEWRSAAKLTTILAGAEKPALLPLALVPSRIEAIRRAGFDPYAATPPSRLRRLWTIWRAARI